VIKLCKETQRHSIIQPKIATQDTLGSLIESIPLEFFFDFLSGFWVGG